jgi:hypothetical protein
MAVVSLGSYTLGGVNIALAASLGLLNPLTAQLDLFLTGSFGLGPFMADLQGQFAAAIGAQASLALQVSNPFLAIQTALTSFANLAAALQAALAFGMPTLGIQLGAQVAAAAALGATLQIKIGGIKALIKGAAAVKIPAIAFVGEMAGAISAGPLHLLSFTGSTLSTTGAQISSMFNAGLGPSDPILPGEIVLGLILVTKDPAVFDAMGVILKTS